MGQISHIQEVFLQNVARLTLRSLVESFESSHLRNLFRVLALVSIARVKDAPHLGQRHLWVPAFVVPFFFIAAPHTEHFGLPTTQSHLKVTFLAKKVA